MNTAKYEHTIFTVILLTFTLMITFFSFSYKPIVRLVPLVISIPASVFLLIILLRDLFIKNKDFSESSSEAKTGHSGSFRIFLWVILYTFFVLFLGFTICTPVFLFLFLLIEGRLKLKKAFTNAVISSATILIFFYAILKVVLWPGLIPEILADFIGGGLLF